jgi:hypothetical protein
MISQLYEKNPKLLCSALIVARRADHIQAFKELEQHISYLDLLTTVAVQDGVIDEQFRKECFAAVGIAEFYKAGKISIPAKPTSASSFDLKRSLQKAHLKTCIENPEMFDHSKGEYVIPDHFVETTRMRIIKSCGKIAMLGEAMKMNQYHIEKLAKGIL